jgi:hypothetical protein
LSGDFDGQEMSLGVLQWNFGQGSLDMQWSGVVGDFLAMTLSTLLGRAGGAVVLLTGLLIAGVLAVDLDLHATARGLRNALLRIADWAGRVRTSWRERRRHAGYGEKRPAGKAEVRIAKPLPEEPMPHIPPVPEFLEMIHDAGGKLYAWRSNGQGYMNQDHIHVQGGDTVQVRAEMAKVKGNIYSSPAVGDIDKDRKPEVFVSAATTLTEGWVYGFEFAYQAALLHNGEGVALAGLQVGERNLKHLARLGHGEADGVGF